MTFKKHQMHDSNQVTQMKGAHAAAKRASCDEGEPAAQGFNILRRASWGKKAIYVYDFSKDKILRVEDGVDLLNQEGKRKSHRASFYCC